MRRDCVEPADRTAQIAQWAMLLAEWIVGSCRRVVTNCGGGSRPKTSRVIGRREVEIVEFFLVADR